MVKTLDNSLEINYDIFSRIYNIMINANTRQEDTEWLKYILSKFNKSNEISCIIHTDFVSIEINLGKIKTEVI